MFLYAYEFDSRAGEIRETAAEVRETEKTYKAIKGVIPGLYVSSIRKSEVQYQEVRNGNKCILTERDPETARQIFRKRAEYRYNFAVEEAERRKAELTALENCPIRTGKGLS